MPLVVVGKINLRKAAGHHRGFCWVLLPPPVYFLRPSSRVRDFCLLSLSSHFLPSCLLRTSKGLSWLSVSSWWKPPSSHYCLMCAKRPAHKQPAGGPNFHFPHAAQRDSIEKKQGKRALGGNAMEAQWGPFFRMAFLDPISGFFFSRVSRSVPFLRKKDPLGRGSYKRNNTAAVER